MKFILKPSLQHIALVKIVISLWNQKDVRNLMYEVTVELPLDIYSTDKEWEKVEQKVIEKVPQLSLPRLLKEKVLGFIKPIGLDIFNFLAFHSNLCLCISLPAELCWTPEGTVDRKRTVEVLVKDESLDISTRHILACIYCLEDSILKLWNIMSDKLKEDFLGTDWSKFATSVHDTKRRGVSFNAQISYRFEFERSAARWGCKAAAEYYLQKLTPTERRESLVQTAKRVTNADVLFFLLSEMDEQQQIEVYENKPYRLLQHFLHWPLQSFFIEVANRMWDFLPKEDYNMLLRKIIEKAANSYTDWNYKKLFREFWQESPNALKSFITDEFEKSCLLFYLFRIKDREYIRLILTDATVTVKEKFIYSDQMNYFCQDCICDNEWDILEHFIQECFPSRYEMLKFKEEFEKRIVYPYFKKYFAAKKYKWDQLFLLSDGCICKDDKRTADEGESSSAKRFCSLK